MTREMRLALAVKCTSGTEKAVAGAIIGDVGGDAIEVGRIYYLLEDVYSRPVIANALWSLTKKAVLIHVQRGVYEMNPYLPEQVAVETKSWLGE